MPTHFDLVILGAEPGGYVAAVRAAQLGRRVAIVEQKYWGGVCLNVGCVPAKSLLRNAELARIVTHHAAAFGIHGEITVDYGAAHARSRKVSEGRSKGIHYLMKKNKVVEFEGRGEFQGPRSMSVALSSGGSEVLTFDQAIIATGSTVRSLPGVALSENVVTYESLILEDSVPESIIIVGAGAIGIEFAYLLSSYGVDVVVVEYLERALPNEDINVSTETQRQFATMGVKIVTPARLESVVDAGNAVNLTYTDKSGTLNQIAAMKVLMSVGFAPNVDGFGLDTTGVLLSAQGAIEIDEFMQTSTEGIYAIGDVTAKLQLAHVAEAQGVVTAEHASTGRAEPIRDYRMMPRATFCQPQVASFGFTEQQARDAGHDVVVSTFPFVANAKSHALGDSSGFVKLIASAEYGQLLGGHLIGHDVSELLPELTLAQAFELTSRELVHNVHTHPTMSEALQEAFHGLEGHMINF